jgi:hypothetical protein
MPFDYKTASAIARYEAISTETLRDFSYAARQTWDELQLSKIENISLQREIKNLQGEIDVLKSSLLEIEAAPQPVVPDFVYDGWSVYQFLSDRAKTRTSTDNVSDVLDAIKAMLKAGKENNNE